MLDTTFLWVTAIGTFFVSIAVSWAVTMMGDGWPVIGLVIVCLILAALRFIAALPARPHSPKERTRERDRKWRKKRRHYIATQLKGWGPWWIILATAVAGIIGWLLGAIFALPSMAAFGLLAPWLVVAMGLATFLMFGSVASRRAQRFRSLSGIVALLGVISYGGLIAVAASTGVAERAPDKTPTVQYNGPTAPPTEDPERRAKACESAKEQYATGCEDVP